MFEILSKLGFQAQKNPWGCRTELVLKSVFFAVCPLRAQIWRAGGAQRCRFFSWISGPCQKWPCRCGAEGFSVFSGFFFDPVFENLKWSSSHPPLFLWVFFLFCSHSSWDWGQRRIAHMFLGSWPSTLLIFWGFLGLLRKTLFFPLKKGYLGSFLSVSFLCLPFVRLAFFHFSLSLSLSISLFLSLFFFLFFFSLLSYLYFYLPCFLLLFLFCCFVFVSWEEQLQNITFESLFFTIYFLFFCFVFQICSYLCFSLFNLCVMVNINVSNYSKKTISKTPILVLHIVKGYRFL